MHEQTKRFLNAPGSAYTHTNGSGQSQVTCANNVTPGCAWIIKPPHGYPEDYRYGQPVENGAFLRLENRALGQHLHSHNGPVSPVTKQGEITCYGSRDTGDLNDNWELQLDGADSLRMGVRLRLIHTLTKTALHSHGGASHPQHTSGDQEVTGFTARDANDYWIIQSTFGPLVVPTLGTNGKSSAWLSALHLGGSLASITGVTLLFLGASLKTTSFVQLLSMVFGSVFILGIFCTVILTLVQLHRVLTYRLRSRAWLATMWMTLGPVGLAICLYLWQMVVRLTSDELQPVMREIFGVR